jgi:hypothetical protein
MHFYVFAGDPACPGSSLEVLEKGAFPAPLGKFASADRSSGYKPEWSWNMSKPQQPLSRSEIEKPLSDTGKCSYIENRLINPKLVPGSEKNRSVYSDSPPAWIKRMLMR